MEIEFCCYRGVFFPSLCTFVWVKIYQGIDKSVLTLEKGKANLIKQSTNKSFFLFQPNTVKYEPVTISHLDVKVYKTIVIHNDTCNIFTCLNCLPFKSHQFRGRQMRPRFFAHQLTQGPSEIVDPLPSDPKHTEFFLLGTASPARCPVADAGKGWFVFFMLTSYF